MEHPSPAGIWQGLVEGGKLTLPWKRELVDPDEEDGDDSDGLPELSLFGAEDDGPQRPAERRVTVAECLASGKVQPTHLLTELTDRALGSRLSRLSLNTRTALSEQGVNVLFAAFGMLRWYESESSDVEILSPLLLVPVALTRVGTTAPWTLSIYEEEVIPNYCLRELMRRDFSLALPELDAEEQLLDDPAGRPRYFDAVREAVRDQARWELCDEVVLGQFAFQKLAMYEDYGRNAADIAAHEHCRRIAGDDGTPAPDPVELPPAERLDADVPPGELHTVLPCDASQLEAILAVKQGASLVLDGPPGTGKSQTIANVIAECLADGKTVLFVSEKAAALEVVKQRLDEQQLGDFVLDCHSHKANKKDVIAELGRCLALPAEEYADRAEELDRLHETRGRLNGYVEALHRPRPPLNITPFQAHGRLAALDGAPASRCGPRDVLMVGRRTLRESEEALSSLAECRAVVEAIDTHPWRGCRLAATSLTLEGDVRHRLTSLADALDELVRDLTPVVRAGLVSLEHPPAEVARRVDRLRQLLGHPEVPAEWLEEEPRRIAQAVLGLAGQAAEYQACRDSLIEFNNEALGADPPPDWDDGATVAEDEWLDRLRPHTAGTVRTRRQHAASVAEDLRELARRVEQAAQAAGEVIDALDVNINSPRLGSLPVLVSLGRRIAEAGPLREVWFNEERAPALRDLASRALSASEELSARREQLALRFSAPAFDPPGAEAAEEAAGFGPFWKRLLPGWRRFRRRVADWHYGATRRAADLLHDFGELRRYHRDAAALASQSAGYEEGLVRRPDGEVDWSAVLAGLDAVRGLQSLLPSVPRPLIDAFCSEGRVDRTFLAEATGRLESAARAFEDQFTAVRQRFACTRVNGAAGGEGQKYSRLRPIEYANWLRSAADALAGHADRLDRVARHLRDGQDVRWDALPDRLAALRRLTETRRRVHEAYPPLAALTETVEHPEMHDWANWRCRSEFLLALLDRHGGELPPPLAGVVAAGPTRRAVAEACQRASANFASRVAPGLEQLAGLFPAEEVVSDGIVIGRAAVAPLAVWLRRQLEHLPRLAEWVRYGEVAERLGRLGLGEVLGEALAGEYPVGQARDAFLARFYRLWLDAVYRGDAVLQGFRVEDHERLVDEFRTLDRAAIASGTGRIRARLLGDPDRPHAEMLGAPASSELGILLREVNKKRRHLPLRQLFAKVPGLLLRVKPCLMMSPLAVSTYLESPQLRFDVVIFDEASQVLPWDAVGAVYRGRQLAVAGDQKQLPPTTFFDRMLGDRDGEDDADDLADFESVLDVLCSLGLPRRRLRWHYRSRREPLIAFSNRHFYGDELVTFPSPEDLDGSTAVRFEHVPEGRWRSGAGFNPVEARRAAELVVRHFERYPDKSLGVITFNQRQQLAVLDELARLRAGRRDLEELFSEGRREPLFVKNLENVQGDERDRIILSVAYGPDEATGRLAMRFGPLNNQGGERRLNVAVTRAREAVTLVSSVRGDDIDLGRSGASGVRLLKAYLDYAERGPGSLVREVTGEGGEYESPFEESVAGALAERGLDVRPQVGCGGFRVDLGIVHPEVPGRFVLGVECDGATYHRTATARDRDRTRQEVLEGLGWRIARVWSTDWVRDPQRQIERLLEAYRSALTAPEERPAEPSEDGAERPTIRLRDFGTGGTSVTYADIEDVPDGELSRLLVTLTVRFGATPREDLVKTAAKELGFKRTGSRIRTRIEAAIRRAISQGRLRDEGEGRVSAS